MKRGVRVAMEMHPPPQEMFIFERCAEYLKVPFYRGSIHKDLFDKVQKSNHQLPATGKTEPLVCVKVIDLFHALKDARGVDEDLGDFGKDDQPTNYGGGFAEGQGEVQD